MSEALPHDAFLPTTRAELEARGWDEVDVVLVSGDRPLVAPPTWGSGGFTVPQISGTTGTQFASGQVDDARALALAGGHHKRTACAQLDIVGVGTKGEDVQRGVLHGTKVGRPAQRPEAKATISSPSGLAPDFKLATS